MTKKKNVYEVDMEQSSEEIKEEDLDQELLKELRKEWEAYPNLRKEFLDDFYNFYFFRDAELKELIKFDPDIHKMIDHLKQHPFRHELLSKVVFG